eukprot:388249-Prymnesium_polylepis.1
MPATNCIRQTSEVFYCVHTDRTEYRTERVWVPRFGDLLVCSPRYDAVNRGQGPGDFSLPLAGARLRAVTTRPARISQFSHPHVPGPPPGGRWHPAYSVFSQRQSHVQRGPRSDQWLCTLRGTQLRGRRAVGRLRRSSSPRVSGRPISGRPS